MQSPSAISAVIVIGLAVVSIRDVHAQIEIRLEPDYLAGSDTLNLDVRMLSDPDSLRHHINAFQFQVVTPPEVEFLGGESRYTLSDKSGWSTGQNLENGLVGGFSSSTDAIVRNGVLIRLQFLLKGTDTSGTIELREFRLNNGMPDHLPVIPSLCLDLVEHLE